MYTQTLIWIIKSKEIATNTYKEIVEKADIEVELTIVASPIRCININEDLEARCALYTH